MSFLENIRAQIDRKKSYLCVGLDPDPAKLPEGIARNATGVREFLENIVEATDDFAVVYKPNWAFFGALGLEGHKCLRELIERVREKTPVILDAKVGDIGNTAGMYARFVYDSLGADAVTLNPYMGGDSIAPFLEYENRFAFVLGITSNSTASEVEKLETANGTRVFEEVVRTFERNFPTPNWGWVAGATRIEEMKALRRRSEDRWLLIPGVGAQGGALEESLLASKDSQQRIRGLVNVSRGILYVSQKKDYAEAARSAAEECVRSMRSLLDR